MILTFLFSYYWQMFNESKKFLFIVYFLLKVWDIIKQNNIQRNMLQFSHLVSVWILFPIWICFFPEYILFSSQRSQIQSYLKKGAVLQDNFFMPLTAKLRQKSNKHFLKSALGVSPDSNISFHLFRIEKIYSLTSAIIQKMFETN